MPGVPDRRSTEFVRQGYVRRPPPTSCFDDPERQAFVRLDQALYERIQAGQFRL